MRFKQPDAKDQMREAMADADASGESNDDIGEPLDHGVNEVLPGYDEALKLRLGSQPQDTRQQLNGIRWGQIEREGARLIGLGAALDDISGCITSGVKQLEDARAWEGEAFEAFKQSADQVVRGIGKASASLRTAGKLIQHTMEKIRELYGDGEQGFRKFSEQLFKFEGMPQYNELHRMTSEKIGAIPLCSCHGEDGSWLPGDIAGIPRERTLAHGRQSWAARNATDGVLTDHWYRWYGWDWDGEDHEQDINMSLSRTQGECVQISPTIMLWFHVAAMVKGSVSQLYDAALKELTAFADSDHFRQLKDQIGA